MCVCMSVNFAFLLHRERKTKTFSFRFRFGTSDERSRQKNFSFRYTLPSFLPSSSVHLSHPAEEQTKFWNSPFCLLCSALGSPCLENHLPTADRRRFNIFSWFFRSYFSPNCTFPLFCLLLPSAFGVLSSDGFLNLPILNYVYVVSFSVVHYQNVTWMIHLLFHLPLTFWVCFCPNSSRNTKISSRSLSGLLSSSLQFSNEVSSRSDPTFFSL